MATTEWLLAGVCLLLAALLVWERLSGIAERERIRDRSEAQDDSRQKMIERILKDGQDRLTVALNRPLPPVNLTVERNGEVIQVPAPKPAPLVEEPMYTGGLSEEQQAWVNAAASAGMSPVDIHRGLLAGAGQTLNPQV